MIKKYIIPFVLIVCAVAVVCCLWFVKAHTFTLSDEPAADSYLKSEQIQPVFGTVRVCSSQDTDVWFTDFENPEKQYKTGYITPGMSGTVRLERGRWYTVHAEGEITVQAVNVRIQQIQQTGGKEKMENTTDRILYQGHASLRITTSEGKIIYIDPYVGDGYDAAADLILVTHSHADHTNLDKIKNRNPGCRIITWKEALEGGIHRTFSLGFVTVEAVEAGYNRNHDVRDCVGFVLTLPDGISVYVSGDTSKTEQMAELRERDIDYAFFCCDGIYNMDTDEAAECAELTGAKHNIPYHMAPGKLFDRKRAEEFCAPNRLIIADGEEIELKK